MWSHLIMQRENNVIMLRTREKTKTRFNICEVGEQTEITEMNKIMINNWINGIVFILVPEEEEKISLVSNVTDEIVDWLISSFIICLWKLK